MDNYRQKYLKYKRRYLDLVRDLRGGGFPPFHVVVNGERMDQMSHVQEAVLALVREISDKVHSYETGSEVYFKTEEKRYRDRGVEVMRMRIAKQEGTEYKEPELPEYPDFIGLSKEVKGSRVTVIEEAEWDWNGKSRTANGKIKVKIVGYRRVWDAEVVWTQKIGEDGYYRYDITYSNSKNERVLISNVPTETGVLVE
jgi:hypothetical protein